MNQCGFCGEYTEALTHILIWADEGEGIDDDVFACETCLDDLCHDEDISFTYVPGEEPL